MSIETKKLNTLIAACIGVFEKTANKVAEKIHIPNRPHISSNIGKTEVISGASTSFAATPKITPIIAAKIIERYSILWLFFLKPPYK